MNNPSESLAAEPSASRAVAPAFATHEKHVIADWSARMARHGLHVEFDLLQQYLSEALRISAAPPDQRVWLVHKTPDGRVALRLWPGLGTIVDTVSRALVPVAWEFGQRDT